MFVRGTLNRTSKVIKKLLKAGASAQKRRNTRRRRALNSVNPRRVARQMMGIERMAKRSDANPMAINPLPSYHSMRPTRTSASDGSVRIHHVELLDSVTATNGVTYPTSAARYEINPGLRDTFPWLSQEAVGFQEYVVNRMCIHYTPVINVTASGSVLMVADYSVTDPPPDTERAASSYSGFQTTLLYNFATLEIDVKRFIHHKLQVRLGEVGADPRLYDGCVVYIGTHDVALSTSPAIAGKLWIEYDVTLRTPQVAPQLAPPTTSCYVAYPNGTIFPVGTTTFIGFNAVLNSMNLKMRAASPATSTLLLPYGQWCIEVFLVFGTAVLAPINSKLDITIINNASAAVIADQQVCHHSNYVAGETNLRVCVNQRFHYANVDRQNPVGLYIDFANRNIAANDYTIIAADSLIKITAF